VVKGFLSVYSVSSVVNRFGWRKKFSEQDSIADSQDHRKVHAILGEQNFRSGGGSVSPYSLALA
jgi:hypothetical protein